MKRQQCTSKNWIYILDYESPRKHASSLVARKALAMKTDILTNGSPVKNHISLKTGFGYLAIRRSFVPIVVPGSSTSFSSSSHPSTSMTLQDRRAIILHLPQGRLLRQLQQCQATVRLEKGKISVGSIPIQCLCQAQNVEGMIER